MYQQNIANSAKHTIAFVSNLKVTSNRVEKLVIPRKIKKIES